MIRTYLYAGLVALMLSTMPAHAVDRGAAIHSTLSAESAALFVQAERMVVDAVNLAAITPESTAVECAIGSPYEPEVSSRVCWDGASARAHLRAETGVGVRARLHLCSPSNPDIDIEDGNPARVVAASFIEPSGERLRGYQQRAMRPPDAIVGSRNHRWILVKREVLPDRARSEVQVSRIT